jgi:hypothetical protein
MKLISGWGLVFGVSLFLCAGSSRAQDTQKPTQTAPSASDSPVVAQPVLGLEPKAIEILKEACKRLAAADTMSFTAVATYESPSLLGGLPLAYTTKSEVSMRRPDKLRVITAADGPPSEFYYDGKTMMAFSPADNLVAIADAPPTIDGALEAAYNSASIYFPFSDVVVADPYKDLSEGLITAFYIGQSQVVGGITTDMIAYGNDKVFMQAWIGAEDKLPRMLRAVYRDDPGRFRHQMEFSNWKLAAAIPAETFTSAKAKNAKRIQFSRPEPPEDVPQKNQ